MNVVLYPYVVELHTLCIHINELVAEFCSFVCTAKTIQSKLGQSSLFVPTQRPI